MEHPLAHWLLSTSLCDYEVRPSDALYSAFDYFLFDPIQQAFATQEQGLTLMLTVLDARFQDKILNRPTFDWRNPFSTKLSFLKDVSRFSPEDLAISITRFDIDMFLHISIADSVDHNSTFFNVITKRNSTLSNDITECLIADPNLTEYMLNLRNVCH